MRNFKLCEIFKGAKKGQKPSLASEWYVYYYFNKNYHSTHLPPAWVRFRIKNNINREKTISDRMDAAKEVAQAMNELLKDGFNPFETSTNNASTIARNNGIFNLREAMAWAMEKKTHFSHKTKIDFKSNLKLFFEVCDKFGYSEMNVRTINRVMMREIIENMVKSRNLGDHAYIKFKNNLHNIFEELLSWEKIEYNPCDFKTTIRKPKPKAKKLLTQEERNRIRQHLEKVHPDFFRFLMMLNHTAIRPVEILRLKVGDVDLNRREIRIRAADTKDKEDRIVVIPNILLPYINTSAPAHFYLFGHTFTPQERNQPLKRDFATKLWHKLIKVEMGIDSNMYWLKHLGLTARRVSGMNPEVLQFIAGHSSYDQTQSNYVAIDRPEVRKQIEEFGEDF